MLNVAKIKFSVSFLALLFCKKALNYSLKLIEFDKRLDQKSKEQYSF